MLPRTLPFVLVGTLAASVALLPLASAQVVPPFTLTVEDVVSHVFPGETAAFNVTVGYPSTLLPAEREASMSALLPAGWTANFTDDPVSVRSGETSSTTLRIYVPADAVPAVYQFRVEASDEWNFTHAFGNVTVKTRPAAALQEPELPAITLSPTSGDSAASGETAQGTLTLTSIDGRTVTLDISIAPAGGWLPAIPAADQTRVLLPGATSSARLQVPIPAIDENTTRSFTVSVRATTPDGAARTYTTTWTVLGIAPEESVFDPQADAGDAAATIPPSSGGASSTPARLEGPNLDVYVEPLEMFIPSGGTQTAVVHLINTGTTPLSITLADSPPTSWRGFTFEPDGLIVLAPGERADVAMTVQAPNVPPGGAANAKVTAIDEGFVRQATFVIHTVPGQPVDETEAATVETPAAPDGALPVNTSLVLVGVGVGAVGSAAAIVASRPLREKLLWGAAGLYTRLARPDVLGHEDREKLYRLVETTPGIHFHALQRDLAWNTGTLTYHLRVLERHGFVVSRRDGLYRRFYLSGAAPRKEVFENQGPTGLRADVLDAVKSTPGISQSDLALGLGANKQTVNYHVKALERAGTIRVEKRGRDTYLFPGDAAASAEKAEA